MQKITKPTTEKEILRSWHLIDAKNNILGRVSNQIANLLMGKSKSYFANNMDCGDFVVVINAKDIKVTGNKETKKIYYRHSMYPGGFKEESLEKLRERKPTDIIVHGVAGMLPKNKLRDKFLTRLFVFVDSKHDYEDKFAKSKKI